MTINQQTLNKEASFSGVGLHTGSSVTVTIKPAAPHHGIVFLRIDVEPPVRINADINQVLQTNRFTSIGQKGSEILTIEHLLSALYASHIDNALIEVNGPELPILDGSAMQYIAEFERIGQTIFAEQRKVFEVKETIHFTDEDTGSEYILSPADEFEATVLLEFESDLLGHQYATLSSLDDYAKEIAGSRTFVFLHELEYLIDQDLIKGGDTNNAVVYVDKVLDSEAISKLSKKLNKPEIEISKRGILNGTVLRYDNEPARHKLLDLIGDLSLLGYYIKGKIEAKKPGHTSNVAFVQMIKKQLKENLRLSKVPHYDPNKRPVLDINAIVKLLPHRPPFLLIDKVIEMSDKMVVCVKNVTMNEPFFQGHFPNNPIFPGVLQLEAMAQTGGILALSMVDEPEKWDTYFLKIDNAKFRDKVVPGDTILFKMELTSPIRRGLVQMRGTAYVGTKLVSEANLIAQIIKSRD